jgi:hypothetical protein
MMFTFCGNKTVGFGALRTRRPFTGLTQRPSGGSGTFCFRSLFLRIVFYFFPFIHAYQPDPH